MAAATVTSMVQVDMPDKVKPIIASGRTLSQDERAMDFTPDVHLAFKEPSEILTMTDLGLPKDNGVSPMAICQPFQLFTANAIARMREEVLSPEVMEKCKYSSNLAACQLRGYANK